MYATDDNEIELIQKAQQGDDDAFSQLFEHHYPFLFKYLLKLTLDEDKSSDIAQETMLKCYQHLSSFKMESKFSTWMITIASRLYMDALRKEKRERKWLEQIKTTLSRQLTWRAKSSGTEFSDTFTDFNQLDVEVRVPILLRHYYGYTYDEIAEMLKIKTGTVKSRVHNGIKQLRKEWDENEQESRTKHTHQIKS